MNEPTHIRWAPPGPVSVRFMASRAKMAIINGPIGSGKTTTCLLKLVKIGMEQAPSTREKIIGPDGVRVPLRKVKFCVVRDTYRNLWKSTLPSWFKRFPREEGDFVGSENAPSRHVVNVANPDGSVTNLWMDFIAIGDNAAEDVLRGYEPTGFYLNECDLMAREVLTFAAGRVGRYPDMAEGGPTWAGVLMDLNAPELGNWAYDDFFTASAAELAAKQVALYRQPSGFSPDAENLANLPEGYYAWQASINEPWYVRRMIENKPGHSRAGQPVYPEFSDPVHVPEASIAPKPDLPLVIGLDAGLNPAAVFGQRLPNGQWVILRELVGEPGTGAKRFGGMLSRFLHDHFAGFEQVLAWADPSAAYGVDKQTDEQTWIEIVAAETKIRVRGAPTTVPTARWEAVRLPLTRLIDGMPGMLVSPDCKIIREGFNASYRFRKIAGGVVRYSEEAEKNHASHPHDALQYLCSGGGEDAEIRGRGEREKDRRKRMPTQAEDYNPLARSVA